MRCKTFFSPFVFFLLLSLVHNASAQIDENFDGVAPPTLPAGWTTSHTGSGNNWVTSAASHVSAPNSVFGADVALVGTETLVTPQFIYDGNHVLTFYQKYSFEVQNSSTGYDGGVLEIKVGGGSFVDIFSINGLESTCPYTHTISSQHGNPLGGRRGWSGTNGGFKSCIFLLPPSLIGESIQYRFVIGTDVSNGSTGWNVDDFEMSQSPDLSVSESVTSPAVAGQLLTFTSKVKNNGAKQINVDFMKTISRGFTLESAASDQGTTTIDGAKTAIRTEFSGLDPGQSVTITTTVRLLSTTPGDGLLTINSPLLIANEFAGRPAAFGPSLGAGSVTGKLVFAKDGGIVQFDACEVINNGAELSGNIAVIAAGPYCNPKFGVLNAQAFGATAIVVINGDPNTGVLELTDSVPGTVTVPVLSMGTGAGNTLLFGLLFFNSSPINGTLSFIGNQAVSTSSVSALDPNIANNSVTSFTTILADSDGDGIPDNQDQCPADALKTMPGVCGCGVVDKDANNNGIMDCQITKDLKQLVNQSIALLSKVKSKSKKGTGAAENAARIANLKALVSLIKGSVAVNGGSIEVLNHKISLQKLDKNTRAAVLKALKLRKTTFSMDKKGALKLLKKLGSLLKS